MGVMKSRMPIKDLHTIIHLFKLQSNLVSLVYAILAFTIVLILGMPLKYVLLAVNMDIQQLCVGF